MPKHKSIPSGGLAQMRGKLPHGQLGRLINSFLFARHVDALKWQRTWREEQQRRRLDQGVECAFTWSIDPENNHDLRLELPWPGFGSVHLCDRCRQPCMIGILHERVRPLLKISEHKVNSWNSGVATGFDHQITQGADCVDPAADRANFCCGGCM